MPKTHSFTATLWQYPGEGATWHFLTLPTELATTIKTANTGPRQGWGSVRVEVTIGNTTWQTSVFPDKQSGSYLLPIKASVRTAEDPWPSEAVACSLTLL